MIKPILFFGRGFFMRSSVAELKEGVPKVKLNPYSEKLVCFQKICENKSLPGYLSNNNIEGVYTFDSKGPLFSRRTETISNTKGKSQIAIQAKARCNGDIEMLNEIVPRQKPCQTVLPPTGVEVKLDYRQTGCMIVCGLVREFGAPLPKRTLGSFQS